MRIATGEEVEEMPNDGKDPAAKALGKKGGVARAKSMTPSVESGKPEYAGGVAVIRVGGSTEAR